MQSTGTLEPLLGIHMFDASNGWAVGGDGTILHTFTGGN
jgi:hypothetical protein